MIPVTIYEANDGSRWDSPDEATKRDLLIQQIEEEVQRLGLAARPSDIDYGRGEGFLQQPVGSREALWRFLKENGWNRDTEGPLGRLSYRAMCFDHLDREWGQPYFANHQFGTRGRCLNPTQGVSE